MVDFVKTINAQYYACSLLRGNDTAYPQADHICIRRSGTFITVVDLYHIRRCGSQVNLQAITSEDVALHGILRGQSSPNRTPSGSLQNTRRSTSRSTPKGLYMALCTSPSFQRIAIVTPHHTNKVSSIIVSNQNQEYCLPL